MDIPKKDVNWLAFNYGIGNVEGEFEINVAKNSQSSSLFEMHPNHLKRRPETGIISKQ